MRTGILLSASMLLVGAAPPPDGRSGTVQALGRCFQAQTKVTPFSGVVLARREGQEFYRAAGFADAKGKVPMRRSNGFRLASVTKVLTRAAIGRLVDSGRLELDAPISRYMNGLPPEIGAVTAQQLLEHRAGVVSLTRIDPKTMKLLYTATTATQLLPLIVGTPLSFKPGEREQYSNGGFILLGALIEAITGESFEAYMNRAVLRPLRMTHTGFVADARSATPMATYVDDETGKESIDAVPPEVMNRRGMPAGDMVSTADDLMKFGDALLSPKFISSKVHARVFPRRGDPPRLGQLGGTIGANTDLSVFPASGWKFVLLSNYGPPNGEIMAEVLRGVLIGQRCKTITPDEWSKRRQAQRESPPR